MTQRRLNMLSLIATESEIVWEMDLINDFSFKKKKGKEQAADFCRSSCAVACATSDGHLYSLSFTVGCWWFFKLRCVFRPLKMHQNRLKKS